MGEKEKTTVEILFVTINVLVLILLGYLLVQNYIIFEVFLALIFLQVVLGAFYFFLYMIHKRIKILANRLGFHFLTRFLEQPRMEGTYKKNWWQIHFASRGYSQYWGMPRTYIKLQYKDDKKFDLNILKKYSGKELDELKIIEISHIKRPYKNYLLLRVNWYIVNIKKIHNLMNYLLDIAKKAKK
jgi:hypothetical protein